VALSEIPGACPIGQIGYFIEELTHMLVHVIRFQIAGAGQNCGLLPN
jgi:hypothetical protein